MFTLKQHNITHISIDENVKEYELNVTFNTPNITKRMKNKTNYFNKILGIKVVI